MCNYLYFAPHAPLLVRWHHCNLCRTNTTNRTIHSATFLSLRWNFSYPEYSDYNHSSAQNTPATNSWTDVGYSNPENFQTLFSPFIELTPDQQNPVWCVQFKVQVSLMPSIAAQGIFVLEYWMLMRLNISLDCWMGSAMVSQLEQDLPHLEEGAN